METTIPIPEAWQRILAARGRIFRVTFRTKTPQYERSFDGRKGRLIAPAGRIRTMICRRLVQKFTLGVISPEARFLEDVVNNVLTVFDIQMFNALRLHLEDQGIAPGVALMQAGRRSYRRLNMAHILNITGA